MTLNEAQARDLQRVVKSGLSMIPVLIPRESVMAGFDKGLTLVPASLRSAQVGDVVDQLAAWRRNGAIR